MSEEHPWRASAAALAVCIATAQAFDVAHGWIRGEHAEPWHMLLVLGLSALVALPVIAIAGRRGPSTVLAVWMVLESVAFTMNPPPFQKALWGLALGLACAGGVFFLLRRVEGRLRPGWLGVCVGAGIFLGFVFVPSATRSEVLMADEELRALAATGGAILATLVASSGLLRTRWPAAAPLAGLLACGLALAWTSADAAARVPPRHFASPPTATGPNILLLVLDTVRADHLSLYGYERKTTPQLEKWLAFEDGAVVYPRAYSTSNWTRPAHASLFSGLLPSEHGCREDNCGAIQPHRDEPGGSEIVLDDTLAEHLSAAGYRTAGTIANLFLVALRGVGKGFDVWNPARPPMTLSGVGEFARCLALPRVFSSQRASLPSAASVNQDVLELLEDCTGGGCFIVANYIDAHEPYFASHPYNGTFGGDGAPMLPLRGRPSEVQQRVAAAYDEEILELDAHVGRLFGDLERRELLDDMWVFVMSDHGESFGDHDSVRHATNVYDDQVRILLAVRPPRGVTLPTPLTPVGLLDVTATISAIATGSPMGRGRDLRDPDATSLVQVEFFGWPPHEGRLGRYELLPSRVVVRDRFKLLEIDGRRELYHLSADPKELDDRAKRNPDEVDRLVPLLPPLDRSAKNVRVTNDEEDRETLEALRALGYVE